MTARQTMGQSRLENSLVLYEKHLASVSPAAAAVAAGLAAAGGDAAAGVSALRAYLEGLTIAGKGPVTLRVECQRRGLKVSGSKPEMVERVEAHAIAKRGRVSVRDYWRAGGRRKAGRLHRGLPAAPNAAAVVEA